MRCQNSERFVLVVLSATVLWVQCKEDGTAADENLPGSSSGSDPDLSSDRTSGNPPADAGDEGVYADVTAVSVTGESGDYTFVVTVDSTDIDCTQLVIWTSMVA